MTAKQITEKAARITYPGLPQEAIERIAVAIWNACPSGSLNHVLGLDHLMQEYPNKPEYVAACVRELRNVEAVAAEWIV